MRYSIERLGWVRTVYSGFRLMLGRDYDTCTSTASYKTHALVLGWWVYQWRVWRWQ